MAKSLEKLKERLSRALDNNLIGLRIHAGAFALASALLIFLNIVTGSRFPWSFFPVCAWGIGMACHLQVVLGIRKRFRQVAGLPQADEKQLALVKKIQGQETGLKIHSVAFAATSVFLAGTNIITSSGFPWSLFPIIGWGAGYYAHFMAYNVLRRRRIEELRRTGISWKELKSIPLPDLGRILHRRADSEAIPPEELEHRELLEEARAIRTKLHRQFARHKRLIEPMEPELSRQLDGYVEQIEKLVYANHEMTEGLEAVPAQSIERELAVLRERQAAAESARLRSEYERAIAQYEQQRRAVRELANHKEILELRIRSALTLLRKLQLDVARLRGLASAQEIPALGALKDKTSELSKYLDDLQDIYTELDL